MNLPAEEVGFFSAYSERSFLEYAWEWTLAKIFQHCWNDEKNEGNGTESK